MVQEGEVRYRVHQYVTVIVPVVVDAESIRGAVQKAYDQFTPNDIQHGEYAEEVLGYLVDPLLENGEVDYESSVECEFVGGELQVNDEPGNENE
jgi:hypothetical protein